LTPLPGDAVTTLAQRHLKEMGVLQELEREGKIHWVRFLLPFRLNFPQKLVRSSHCLQSQTGGFVSPSGYSFIGIFLFLPLLSLSFHIWSEYVRMLCFPALCRDLLCTFGFSCVFSQQLMSSGNSAKEINRSTEALSTLCPASVCGSV
jgi:hypothetical protein